MSKIIMFAAKLKKYNTKKYLLLIGGLFLVALPVLVFARELTYPTILGKTFTDDLAKLIEYIYYFSLAIGGILALGAVIFGGIRYFISAGNPQQITAAKDNIGSGLIGLVILLGSYLILTTINPELAIIQPPTLTQTTFPPPPPRQITDAVSVTIADKQGKEWEFDFKSSVEDLEQFNRSYPSGDETVHVRSLKDQNVTKLTFYNTETRKYGLFFFEGTRYQGSIVAFVDEKEVGNYNIKDLIDDSKSLAVFTMPAKDQSLEGEGITLYEYEYPQRTKEGYTKGASIVGGWCYPSGYPINTYNNLKSSLGFDAKSFDFTREAAGKYWLLFYEGYDFKGVSRVVDASIADLNQADQLGPGHPQTIRSLICIQKIGRF